MKPASEMRPGMVLELDDELYRVVQSEYHAGGGKMHGSVHARLQCVRTGSVTERRFRQDERLHEVDLERLTMVYLYADADQCVFMHPETYEQMELPKASLGPYLPFIQPDDSVQVELYEGSPVELMCPATAEVRVDTTAEPVHVHASNVLKDATLENGMEVHVPQFIKSGDVVRVEVDSHKYVARVR